MKLNELKITALPQGSEVKGTPIEPEMDLEFKTDIKQTPGREHTNANPDYTQELAPEGVPQNAWNTLRDQHYAPKPESEWSNVPNKYAQKLIDLRNKGIDAVKGFAGDVKDKFLNWRGLGAPSIEDIKGLIKREDKKYPQNWKAPEQSVWTGESMENLNRMRTLAGLNEKDEDVWAYSPKGEGGAAARVVRTEHGYQVYVMGPYGWIAQGQPHESQEEAQDDALSFFEAVSMLSGLDQLNEEDLLEIRSALELNEEQLTEEQTNEHKVVSVLSEKQLNELWPLLIGGAAAGYGLYKGGKALGKWMDKEKGQNQKAHDDKIASAELNKPKVNPSDWPSYKNSNKKKVTDSTELQPWWRDMSTTLQEMKAEMLSIPKKKI